MMVVLHFLAGTLGALLIAIVAHRISGATSFSAPFGVIFLGVGCASLAHFVTPWATPVVLALYAITSVVEALRDRKAAKSSTQ